MVHGHMDALNPSCIVVEWSSMSPQVSHFCLAKLFQAHTHTGVNVGPRYPSNARSARVDCILNSQGAYLYSQLTLAPSSLLALWPRIALSIRCPSYSFGVRLDLWIWIDPQPGTRQRFLVHREPTIDTKNNTVQIERTCVLSDKNNSNSNKPSSLPILISCRPRVLQYCAPFDQTKRFPARC